MGSEKDSAAVDVIVVGGGPAGSSAAIFAAQSGLRVTLLERSEFPRDRPGETLHPGVETLFQQLGVADRIVAEDFQRYEGHSVQWGSAPRFEAFGSDASGPWKGFHAWRARFDAILLDRARELGVRVLQPCPATDPLVATNRIVGVKSPEGRLPASFVMDAAGDRHWLAKKLSLSLRLYSRKLVVRYGYDKSDTDVNAVPTLTADPDGWTWRAGVGNGLVAWSRLWIDAERAATDPQWRAGDKGVHGADVTWRKVEPLAGPGYFLLGDSAAVLDPASSHGVLKAMTSGMMAAHLAVQVLRKEQSEELATRSYCEWLNHWFLEDVRKLNQLYSVFKQWQL